MTRPIEAGTIISGTLRNEDLLNAFSSELERLVGIHKKELRLLGPLGIAHLDPINWDRVSAHRQLISDAIALLDQYETGSEIDESITFIPHQSDIVNELMDALNEYAPENMYFGTLEGDGADFGFWVIESEVQV